MTSKKSPRARKGSIRSFLWCEAGTRTFIVAMIALCVGGWYALVVYRTSLDVAFGYTKPLGTAVTVHTQPPLYRTLDGAQIGAGVNPSEPIFAMSIEDTVDALPIKGLSHAGVVYEVPMESTITRLVALFQERASSTPFTIGPIRSIRPYFLDIVRGYGGFVFHVGGSPAALAQVERDVNVFSINEISGNGAYFYRDNSRPRPHNVFITSGNALQAVHALRVPAQKSAQWRYKNDARLSQRKKNAPSVVLGDEEFAYSREQNVYMWKKRGVAQVEPDGAHTQVAAKNVIVMKVPRPKVLDSEGRLSVSVVGKGSAILYRDGLAVQGYWKQTTALSRIEWFDSSGKPLLLNRGMTWVYVSS